MTTFHNVYQDGGSFYADLGDMEIQQHVLRIWSAPFQVNESDMVDCQHARDAFMLWAGDNQHEFIWV